MGTENEGSSPSEGEQNYGCKSFWVKMYLQIPMWKHLQCLLQHGIKQREKGINGSYKRKM